MTPGWLVWLSVASLIAVLASAGIVIAASEADALSLTSFEIGLFGWMALMRFVFFHLALEPNSPVF